MPTCGVLRIFSSPEGGVTGPVSEVDDTYVHARTRTFSTSTLYKLFQSRIYQENYGEESIHALTCSTEAKISLLT